MDNTLGDTERGQSLAIDVMLIKPTEMQDFAHTIQQVLAQRTTPPV